MASSEVCECGFPVGYRIDGGCPRRMQNSQPLDCLERSYERAKWQLAELVSALSFLAHDGDLLDLWHEADGFHAETPHGLHGVTAASASDALLYHSQQRGWQSPTAKGSDDV